MEGLCILPGQVLPHRLGLRAGPESYGAFGQLVTANIDRTSFNVASSPKSRFSLDIRLRKRFNATRSSCPEPLSHGPSQSEIARPSHTELSK